MPGGSHICDKQALKSEAVQLYIVFPYEMSRELCGMGGVFFGWSSTLKSQGKSIYEQGG